MVTTMWGERLIQISNDTLLGGIAHGKRSYDTIVGTRPEIIRLSSTIKAVINILIRY